MQKVINVIEDNIANENFNVKILADTLCMSQPTLYRKVKEHFHPNCYRINTKNAHEQSSFLIGNAQIFNLRDYRNGRI